MKKILEIVIVNSGMPFGPNTLKHKSLGGSETAALSLGKELKEAGHIVTIFTNLPTPGSPDFIESGVIGADNVRYVGIDQYFPFITSTEVDLLICLRSPELFRCNHQARKSVLWVHDLATYNGPSKLISEVAWTIDEVWCVSEWHADQYSKVTGYPRAFTKVLQNAITKQNVNEWTDREKTSLFYAARPERGLEALVRPGGIMSRIPDYRLKIAMYDNYPDHMRPYYDQLFSWASQLPNVQFLGALTQEEVRQTMRNCIAYVYPTRHEETSCILAREAMEQDCQFIYTAVGALPETLGDYGHQVKSEFDWNSDEYCKDWAEYITTFVPALWNKESWKHHIPRYWNDVAKDVERMFHEMDLGPGDTDSRNAISLILSLIEDSDVIPAIALMERIDPSEYTLIHEIQSRITVLYPYLYGKESFESYYERYFVREDSKGARVRRSMVGNPRYESISSEIAEFPAPQVILDYGCAEGVIILDLAKRFPQHHFIGIDFAQTNVKLCQEYAAGMNLNNVEFHQGSTENWPDIRVADVIICTEVLEHVTEPWSVIGFLEQRARRGGRVILTVPMGPWEAIGLYDRDQYWWRAHIWHINKWMLRTMFSDKTECKMSSLPAGASADGRAIGHLTFSYMADHSLPHPINSLEKVARHRMRESVTACMIVNNSDMLMRTLKSIQNQVKVIDLNVATENLDEQKEIFDIGKRFSNDHPWVSVHMEVAPAIVPKVWGFDDARNRSIKNVETDWVLWIDSDEYLSGNFTKYLRANAFDSYAIHQHHFTCDPRGEAPQMDKPARLFRVNRGFAFFGKIHEHAEKGVNGGPGFCMVLGDVDIGHAGYTNEITRRDRFSRNFPFLEWDHAVNPDRHLSKYLWLRDVVQRMRYYVEQGDLEQARLLAVDAVAYYKKEWSDWNAPGMGGEQAFHYYSEALSFLGKGMPLQIQLDMGEEKARVSGVFESEDDVAKMIKEILKGRFENRRSGHWQ